MLLTTGNTFNFYATNADAPTTTPGTLLTTNTILANVKGNWSQLISSANLTSDVYWVAVNLNGGRVNGVYQPFRLDIGVDNAGGTSYTTIIPDVISCNAGEVTTSGLTYVFPIFIKAGSSVAARVASNLTSITIRCMIEVFGRPSAPHLLPVGTFAEAIGLGTAPAATSFTPGNSGAEGSWASLGTTTNDLFWFQLGVQCSDTSMSTLYYTFDLAYGDGTNFVPIVTNKRVGTSAAEQTTDTMSIGGLFQCYKPVPAGSTIYVRGSCSGTADLGWEAACVGVG